MNYLKKIFSKEKSVELKKGDDSTNHLEYPTGSMINEVEKIVKDYPYNYALEYYGNNITYKKFYELINKCAKSLKMIGVEPKDKVTICMPNMPEAIIMFYAVNLIGAVGSMIHPLASVNEIEYYIDAASSKYILTVDLFAKKVIEAARKAGAKKIIISSVTDGMSFTYRNLINIYTDITNFINKQERLKFDSEDLISWKSFMTLGESYFGEYIYPVKAEDEAVILYSGGTTGKPKGVRLSNLGFNAVAKQCSNQTGARTGDSALVILPIFHGFGLAVSVHTPLINGLRCVLIPRFKQSDFAKLIKKYKPSFLIGVPAMFEALTHNEDKSDYLKSVKNAICGGDILTKELNDKVNNYFKAHGSIAEIRLGYGLTESTAACSLTPRFFFKENCIGKALADMNIVICKEGTTKELRNNKVGEICVNGPSVMLGYLNEEEETKNTLKMHEDGKIYLHSGDLGYINKDGYIFFKSRLKRMIVTNGYNVYPSVMEKIIREHPAIEDVVVVGIPHPYKKQVPIANIVLKDNYNESAELTDDIKKFCEKSIAKYSMPYRYNYIKNVPKTLIGKVNFKKLEEECTRKYEKKNERATQNRI